MPSKVMLDTSRAQGLLTAQAEMHCFIKYQELSVYILW